MEFDLKWKIISGSFFAVSGTIFPVLAISLWGFPLDPNYLNRVLTSRIANPELFTIACGIGLISILSGLALLAAFVSNAYDRTKR